MKRTTLVLIGLLMLGAMGCDRDDRRVEPDRRHHRRHVSEVGIRGVVVDQDGRAIAHHAVQFVHKDQVWRGLTDDEGRYTFIDLPSEYEGRVVVFYEDQEFSERIRLPRRGYEQCEMRIRRPHRHHKPVTPRRHYCEVTGRVYQGRHAQPNTDVVLQIRGQRDRITRTNKNGRYTFNYVPLEQRGRITVQRPGAQGSVVIYTGNRPGEVKVDKLYIESLPAPTPPKPQRRYCEVIGRVYVGRQAQPNTAVVLQIRGQRDRTARTDKHGRYTFNRVPLEQRGRISVQRPGAQGSVTLYTGNRTGEVKAGNLMIEPLPSPTPHRHTGRRDGQRAPDAPARSTNTREDRKAEERRQKERDRARAEAAAQLKKQQEAEDKAYRQLQEQARKQAAKEAERKRQEEKKEARQAKREQARQREALAAQLKRQQKEEETRRKQQAHAEKRKEIEAKLQKQQDLKEAHQERIAQAMARVAEARARQKEARQAAEEERKEPVKSKGSGRRKQKSEPKPEPTPEVTPEPEPEPAAEPEEDLPATRRSRRRRS